jgi:hypothetical protein
MSQQRIDKIRLLVLLTGLTGMGYWCAQDLREGLTVLLMLVTVPPLTLLVKTVVEGALVFIDDRIGSRSRR